MDGKIIFAHQMALTKINSNQLIILDEVSFLKRILHIYSPIYTNTSKLEKMNYEVSLKKIVKKISNNIELAFFINVEPEKLNKRLEDRKKRLRIESRLSKNERLEMYRFMNNALEIIHKTLLENDVQSIILDNNSSLAETKEQLRKILDEVVRDL